MIQSKKNIYMSVLFLSLISFTFVSITYAEEEPISISLDCFDSCKDKVLNYSNNILLELTIKNNLDYWAHIIGGGGDGGSIYFTVSNDKLLNGKEIVGYPDLLGQFFFIKPREEAKLYIPFKTYNNNNPDDRLGDWRISPKLHFYEVKFYRNPSDSNNIYDVPIVNSPITGNDLWFEVEKPESKIQKEKSSSLISKGLSNTIDIIINSPWSVEIVGGLIVGVIVTILGIYIHKRMKMIK